MKPAHGGTVSSSRKGRCSRREAEITPGAVARPVRRELENAYELPMHPPRERRTPVPMRRTLGSLRGAPRFSAENPTSAVCATVHG